MLRSILGFSAVDKTPNQVNTQAQRDDLEHILQKAITGIWPQSAGQKNHHQAENDAQHEVNRVGSLGNGCLFSHGLAPVLGGMDQRAYFNKAQPPWWLGVFMHPGADPGIPDPAQGLMAGYSLGTSKTCLGRLESVRTQNSIT